MTFMPPATDRGDEATLRRAWPWALLIGLFALVAFGLGVAAEAHFADESAYITQSYYYDLFWLRGDRSDRQWLEYPALDLPPGAKYLIGAALDLAGHRRPVPSEAMAWYHDIDRRPESGPMLVAARVPAVILGALGCVATFALGTLAGGRRVGLVAACLLIANPLYRLSAHRAMADMPAQAMVLATTAVGLWTWRGIQSGRWNCSRGDRRGRRHGLLWRARSPGEAQRHTGPDHGRCLASARRRRCRVPVRQKLLICVAFAVAGIVAIGTFVTLNPFMTAPVDASMRVEKVQIVGTNLWDRASAIVRNRESVTRGQVPKFREAIRWWPERPLVVAVQGFGRFGLLGPPFHNSQVPYDRYDWGGIGRVSGYPGSSRCPLGGSGGRSSASGASHRQLGPS